MDEAGMVTVEFYGIPRQRAGRGELTVRARTVAEALAAIEKTCPRFAGVLVAAGRISPHYLVSINGEGFTSEPAERLRPGDHVLLLSADVGG